MDNIAVLGPGGVGGLLGALLARAGASVTCLAGPSTVAVLTERGIRVESGLFGDFTVPRIPLTFVIPDVLQRSASASSISF